MIAPESGHSDQLRDPTAYVCPHQGLLSGARPGCLVHPLGATVSGRNESLFGEKICDSFLCPAHTVLNEDQKKKIVAHIHDWYYYSFAIADPASLQWFLAVLSARFNADPGNGEILEKALFAFLEIHVRYLIATPGPIFFYSVPEYNIGRKNFCLASDAPHLDGEKNEILEAIAKVL